MTTPQPATMAYMTVDELRAAQKSSKYHNEPIVVDGIRFDSRKEARRYRNLQVAEQAGVISDLRRQVRYDLHAVGGLKVATYVADHVYTQDGHTVVEDVKSVATRKLPMYRLKKRWMAAEHGIEIMEV